MGTTTCQQNWNGGGGGGAGGTSSAGSLQSAAVTEGVNTGDGSALICFTAPEFTVSGTASGQTGTVSLQLTSSAGTQTTNVAAGSASFAFADGLPDGANWSVDVAAAPAGQLCTVSPSTGVVSGADVNLALTCTTVTVEIAPATLPDGVAGEAYSQTITASSANGGTAPYTFAITSGALPAGLSLTSAGALSGVPIVPDSYDFTVLATDGNGFTGARNYTLAVDAPAINLQPDVLPEATAGTAYGPVTLSADGGTAPYTYAVTLGDLPQGLTLDAAGQLSGTPTEAGTFNVTVTATDGNDFTGTRDYALVVEAPTITLQPAALPGATGGVAYGPVALSADGGAAPYAYAVTLGALPRGVTLDAAGQLSGTPTEAGTFNVTVTATDDNDFTGTQDYTLVVEAPNITLAPDTLPAGSAGFAYGPTNLAADGGTVPYTYAVTGGQLPGGLTLDAGGTLSGAPLDTGSFTVTVTATDDSGFTGLRDYTITVDAPAITIEPDALPNATAGFAYAPVAIEAAGGVAPYSYSVTSGALPNGLQLDPDGTLSGTPVDAGSFTVSVTATDDNGFTGMRDYTIAVDAPAITIEPDALAGGTAGSAYGPVAIEASGGVAPYGYAVTSGTLPDGIQLDASGTLSGVPIEAGSFAITLTATDGNDFAGTRDYTIVVDAPEIALTPDTVPGGKVGDSYDPVIVSADGGTAPYTYAVADGALPRGLALNANTGELSGTPTEAGSFNATVTATDAYGFKGTIAYAVAIEALAPPEAQDHTLDVVAGTSGTLDLPRGATGGPFLAANIVSPADESSGTARIERVEDSYRLTFAASATFAGTAQMTYTLSNADGVSEPATVTINVIERPDPSLDPEVVGLIRAQTEASKRFAVTQIDNFSSRLEQVRNEGDRRNNSFDMRLGYTESSRSSSADREMEQFVSSLGASGGTVSMSGPTGLMAYAPTEPATRKEQTPTGLTAYGSANPPPAKGPIPTGSSTGGEAQQNQGQTLYGPDLGRYAVWSSGFVNFAESDSGGMDIDATTVGMSGGIDYRFSSRLVAGFGVGYGRDKSDIGENGTESRGNAYSAAIYGSYKLLDNLYIDGVLGGSQLDFDSVRYITQTGGYAQGDRSGSQIFGAVTTAYEFRDDQWLVSPYGRLRFSRSWLDGFTEQGGGIDNLTYGDQRIDTVSGVLGLRANYTFAMDWGALQPGTRVEYIHDFAGSSRTTIGYADIGTLPYLVELEPERNDYATLGFSLDASFNNGMNAGFEYQTSFGNDIQDHAFRLRFGAKF